MSEINWDTPEIAERYDRNCDHQFLKGQMLVGMMGISTGDSVLDLGCGTGRQAEHIYGIIGRFGHLTGIDPSSHRLVIAQRRFESLPDADVVFLQGQAEHLISLQDSFFRHALFCSSFHWVDDKPVALAEVYRVLKPGGCIGMTTLNREGAFLVHDSMNEVLTRYGLPESEMHGHEGMKRVSGKELEKLLADAGFIDITIDMRMISSYHHSPREYLDKQGPGSFNDIISHLDESLQQEIRQVFLREYEERKTKYPSGTGPGTLFATAKK